MKLLYYIISVLLLGWIQPVAAQDTQNEWPRTIRSGNQLIKVYQWQPLAYNNGALEASAAISVRENETAEPTFGVVWLKAAADENGDRINIRDAEVTALKLPNESDEGTLSGIRNAISTGIASWGLSLSSADLKNNLQLYQQEEALAADLSTQPPTIMYTDRPSLLVVIDGTPQLRQNSQWGVETVVNTPFILIKTGGRFYLYGGKHWYAAPAATGPYALVTNVPANLSKLQAEIAEANKTNNVQQEENDYTISDIIVSTEPAELIQSNGEPDFTPITQTNLLYVRNSANDIFMDINSQQYFVLLSGRWYKSTALKGKWNYVASDKLPADFAKIPEGSAKDNVLASVAGTVAATDAVMDAQVPQTAKVNRNEAAAEIQYDGEPRFDAIEGTDLAYAINTPDYVIRWRGSYYAVDNGVWFHSYNPNGPWQVSAERPYAVALIPPRYPVYAMKFVYIYDVTPDFIYMGYSRGYLNSFVYGPTVVYGTGYYYRPWFGQYYYARPYTWGFNMHYNPWFGWSFGFNYTSGWFHLGLGNYSPWAWGGWWGPAVYRPVYYPAPYYGRYRHGYYGNYGYRGRNTVIVNNVNIYRNNNIYNYRSDVVTRDNRQLVSYDRSASRTPGSRPDYRGNNRVNREGNSGRPVSPSRPAGESGGRGNTGSPTRPNRPAFESDRNPAAVGERPAATQPSRPTARPQQPAAQSQRPEARPQQPAVRPQQPATQPSRPAARPQQPAAQPQRPEARPQQPSVRPQQPATQPSRPTARPPQPAAQSQRPAAQPQQPAARPQQRSAQPQRSTEAPRPAQRLVEQPSGNAPIRTNSRSTVNRSLLSQPSRPTAQQTQVRRPAERAAVAPTRPSSPATRSELRRPAERASAPVARPSAQRAGIAAPSARAVSAERPRSSQPPAASSNGRRPERRL